MHERPPFLTLSNIVVLPNLEVMFNMFTKITESTQDDFVLVKSSSNIHSADSEDLELRSNSSHDQFSFMQLEYP
jgi:hypothetical protein